MQLFKITILVIFFSAVTAVLTGSEFSAIEARETNEARDLGISVATRSACTIAVSTSWQPDSLHVLICFFLSAKSFATLRFWIWPRPSALRSAQVPHLLALELGSFYWLFLCCRRASARFWYFVWIQRGVCGMGFRDFGMDLEFWMAICAGWFL